MIATQTAQNLRIPGYQLTVPLGQGTHGQVWKANGPGNTPVAIKFVDLHRQGGYREWHAIQSIKRLRHANLMPTIAVWMMEEDGIIINDEQSQGRAIERLEDAGQVSATLNVEYQPRWLAIAMPLGQQTLAQRLQQCDDRPGIPPDELCGYLMDVARAIDYLNRPAQGDASAHEPIQHCDVKPANIMLSGTSAQLCDFGVAQGLDEPRLDGVLGSPAYMAPECIRDGVPSRASDQYSLAITYVELRTGRLPFDDESLDAVTAAHLSGTLNLSRLPKAERAVIGKATSVDPELRYDSATEMVEALQRALHSMRKAGRAPKTVGGHSVATRRPIAPSAETQSNRGAVLDETKRHRSTAPARPDSRSNRMSREQRAAEAVRWYRQAALQGSQSAQKNLGDCCFRGLGVQRDYHAAVRWYYKAAKQGHAAAQNNLGVCYYRGRGVSRNRVKAMKWFRRAAEQGHAAAQNNLAHCYRFGV